LVGVVTFARYTIAYSIEHQANGVNVFQAHLRLIILNMPDNGIYGLK